MKLVLNLYQVSASEIEICHFCRPSTGGSMNPIRTLGPAVSAGNYMAIWVYLLAPVLGGLAGAAIYTAVKLHGEEGETPRPRSFRR